MNQSMKRGTLLAVLAAALYAASAPFSKILLAYVPSTLMAGLLYLGAGMGALAIAAFRKLARRERVEIPLSKKELPYVIAMIALDVAAPVCLLLGLSSTTAANAALLNNFEIVATSLIALMVFKEAISRRLWAGIACVTVSCMVLSFEDLSSLRFSQGSLLILLAAVCWGFENNCTRRLSAKDPMQIVLLKGVFSGLASTLIGLFLGERAAEAWSALAVLGVGLVAYGMSIFCYVHAQRLLGAARTSAYYAVAPFIGALLSLLLLREAPPATYYGALLLMALGAWLCSQDRPLRRRKPRRR